MGTKIEENPFGDECWNWDPTYETPEFIYGFFWDILKGTAGPARQAPNLHIFKMSQIEPDACIWRYANLDFGWQAEFGLQAAQCWLLLVDANNTDFGYFVHTKAVSPPAEYEIFTNFFQSEDMSFGYEGFGTIFWLDSIRDLAAKFGLDLEGETLLEMRATDSQKMIIKLCNLRMNTNVKIQLQ